MLPELDAEFVGENVPDGTWIQPGCHFLKLWRLRNCGAQTWTEDTKVHCAHSGLTVHDTGLASQRLLVQIQLKAAVLRISLPSLL